MLNRAQRATDRERGLLRPRLEIAEMFPPIEDELDAYRHLFTGNVLNAGCGDRDIRALVAGRLFNQDIADGLHPRDVDIESPLDRIPVEDGFFNTIICNAVLEHVANPDDVMREFARVCAPGGTLYLTIPFMQPEHKDPTDFQRYTLDGLGLLCQRHGFRVVELHGIHNVYATLAWVLKEWLDPLPTRRAAVLRAVLYPWLRRKLRTARHHVPALASAHRAIAIREVDAA